MKYLSGLLNRIILLGTGLGLLGWGAAQAQTYMTAIVATKAFVNGKITTLNAATAGTVKMKNDIESGNPVKTGQTLLRISNSLEISNQLKDVRLGLAEEKAKLNAIQSQIKNISQSLYVILESSKSRNSLEQVNKFEITQVDIPIQLFKC